MKQKSLMALLPVVLFFLLPLHLPAQQQEKFTDTKFRGNVFRFLRQHLLDDDKNNIDFDSAYYLQIENKNHYFLRIPFKEKPINMDFIGLDTDSLGNCNKGSIVHRIRGKLSRFSEYADSFVIYSLNRDTRKLIYITPLKGLSDTIAANVKVWDPAINIGNDQKLNLYVHLNIAAILNPGKLELMESGYGYGIAPAGETSGGFGTYSYYFDIYLTARNYLPPSADEVEFERP
jgi:hypothetical protein